MNNKVSNITEYDNIINNLRYNKVQIKQEQISKPISELKHNYYKPYEDIVDLLDILVDLNNKKD
jgi:hypothetical protein